METHRVSYSLPNDASILKAFPRTLASPKKTVDPRSTRAMKNVAIAVADAVVVVPDALLTAIAVPETAVAAGRKRAAVFYQPGPHFLLGVHPADSLHDLLDRPLICGVSPLFQRLSERPVARRDDCHGRGGCGGCGGGCGGDENVWGFGGHGFCGGGGCRWPEDGPNVSCEGVSSRFPHHCLRFPGA